MDRIILLLLIILLTGCNPVGSTKTKETPITRDNSLNLDAWLDSMNNEGEYCLVRGSDREYDTIIDHIRYKYVKEEGYDTPVK